MLFKGIIPISRPHTTNSDDDEGGRNHEVAELSMDMPYMYLYTSADGLRF